VCALGRGPTPGAVAQVVLECFHQEKLRHGFAIRHERLRD
jgi:hypothetical protein